MGQVALGLRSLAIKLAIFFVLAAALAWALGGTLFPRPERAELHPVEFAGKRWHVRLSLGGSHPGEPRYELMSAAAPGDPVPVGGQFVDATELVATPEALYVAMRRPTAEGSAWVLRRINPDGTETTEILPDRLAIEQALQAARHGGAG